MNRYEEILSLIARIEERQAGNSGKPPQPFDVIFDVVQQTTEVFDNRIAKEMEKRENYTLSKSAKQRSNKRLQYYLKCKQRCQQLL